MKYGFIIDNRKCIGCHACTTACKSEHDVPIGVNRTWVKQVEKGEFPDTRRLFSVMRCNQCTDAPCVTICPTESLYFRSDGIVDFDKDRCIGCKSCMQACPYDALYIDPETSTAAKCNYCAHRVDIGLEPACVNVCPEHAIISGDMEDPNTEISQLLARQAVKTRKPEKGTKPNLFYIDVDDVSIIPTATEKQNVSLWGSQESGVGHFARAAEKLAFSNEDILSELSRLNENSNPTPQPKAPKTVEVLMNKSKEVYNTPDKGILWGWEVSAYVWTKAISTGAFLFPFLGWLLGWNAMDGNVMLFSAIVGLIFLTLTGILLVMDLDRPDRFLYVLLRPHWESWLVKGGYAITIYGGLLSFIIANQLFKWEIAMNPFLYITGSFAVLVAIYTAFLFAQAKGRDFWQSPGLSFHMLVHAFLAGAALFIVRAFFIESSGMDWYSNLAGFTTVAILVNLFILCIELTTVHPTEDAALTVRSILKGRYKMAFWGGSIVIGNIIPLLLLGIGNPSPFLFLSSALALLIGIYITEHIWVEAPQRIPLS